MVASCQEDRSPRGHCHAHLSLGLSGITGNDRLWSLGLFCLVFFLGLHLRHVEVPQLGVELDSAAAAGLRHSHSNTGSELYLQTTPQLVAMQDP